MRCFESDMLNLPAFQYGLSRQQKSVDIEGSFV